MLKRRCVVIANVRRGHPIVKNVLDRDFMAAGANCEWTSDSGSGFV
ncbi:MAG: hypothetical protein ABI876_15665 [Bacteroidota bacterium]